MARTSWTRAATVAALAIASAYTGWVSEAAPVPTKLLALESLEAGKDRSLGLDAAPRVVGGYTANAYPSYGFSAGSGLCGGTLIYPEYVPMLCTECTNRTILVELLTTMPYF